MGKLIILLIYNVLYLNGKDPLMKIRFRHNFRFQGNFNLPAKGERFNP